VRVAAIVPAAGRGDRLGGGVPKALRMLGAAPVLVHAVRALEACSAVNCGVIAAPAHAVDQVQTVLAAARTRCPWEVVAGAETRQGSVAHALAALTASEALPGEIATVLVHDAARCLVPVSVVQRVVDAVAAGAEAVVPVVPVSDTVKQVQGHDVVATLDRSQLRQVQTPQGFRREVLERAYALARGPGSGAVATDDAGLAERAGATVVVVDGHPEAFKVTGPLDLLLGEALLRSRA
jgi:2-C-methyl-D-erythritol 4-phosphate cytidylyltransferase